MLLLLLQQEGLLVLITTSRASAKPALSRSIGSLAAESPAEISQLQIRQPSALARQGSKSQICAALLGLCETAKQGQGARRKAQPATAYSLQPAASQDSALPGASAGLNAF
jgi:hypothetical protein